jgi:Flp pilus assembly protein TadD
MMRLFQCLFSAVCLLAFAGCSQIESITGTSQPPQFRKASEAARRGDIDAAVKQYTSAAEAHPDKPEVLEESMKALEKMGRSRDAEAMLNRVLEKLPPTDTSSRPQVLVWLAVVHLNAGRPEEAVRLNREALQLAPNNDMIINNLAYSITLLPELKAEQLKEALELASRAVDIARTTKTTSPVLGVYLDTLGWVYHRMGRYKDALTVLQEAARLMPGHDEISFHLARTYEALNRNLDAYIEIRRAVTISPQKPAWLKALQEIRAKLKPSELDQLRENQTNPDY